MYAELCNIILKNEKNWFSLHADTFVQFFGGNTCSVCTAVTPYRETSGPKLHTVHQCLPLVGEGSNNGTITSKISTSYSRKKNHRLLTLNVACTCLLSWLIGMSSVKKVGWQPKANLINTTTLCYLKLDYRSKFLCLKFKKDEFKHWHQIYTQL